MGFLFQYIKLSTVTTGFFAVNSNWGKRACTVGGLSGWTTALDSGNSERLACCGRGTCHGFQSTVGSAATEVRALRELRLHTFILRTPLCRFDVQNFDEKP